MRGTTRRALAGAACVAVAVSAAPRAGALELRRVVSRENKALDISTSDLALGRDGRVYLTSHRYVLDVRPDGSDKRGVEIGTDGVNATAAASGVVAIARARFEHRVEFRGPDLAPIGQVGEFANSDAAGWQSPSDVEAAPSGDFYAIDPSHARILRVAPPAKTVATYPIDQIGEPLQDKAPRLRVWERGQRFYVVVRGDIHVMAFDGRLIRSFPARVEPGATEGWHGGFDVDEEGHVYFVADEGDAVQVFDPDGNPLQKRSLQTDRRGGVSGVRVRGGELFLKRRDPATLFEVYDLATGALRRVVRADADEVTVTLASDAWTAGAPVPMRVSFVSGSRAPAPAWGAWLRPLGAPAFEALAMHDEQVTPPPDAGGLYQLRVSAGVDGAAGEYGVDTIVAIRAPNAQGTLSIFTRLNRFYFGAGEPIPFTVVARGGAPASAAIELRLGATVVARAPVLLRPDQPQEMVIPAALTRALRPGRYELGANAPGLTVASQPLEIGPGIAVPPSFDVVQHGDYTSSLPGNHYFDAPEIVDAQVARARKLGLNMFVDRLTSASATSTLADAELAARLRADPRGAAPEKATFEGPDRRTIAAEGAYGIEQRAILLGMDAHLPLGTGADTRTPEQLGAAIHAVTAGLATYPAFRGWSWAANWWLHQTGANATANDDEKAAYIAALRAADTTGAWSPVLDAVSDRMFAMPADAERQLRGMLRRDSPTAVSAVTGPYRALGIWPPVAFHGADEVDLHFQAEQVQPPLVTANEVDFYKRPGKRAWGHPEVWNDDGTGGMLIPALFAMAMRGADGVGVTGSPPFWATGVQSDPRSAAPGIVSVVRATDHLLLDYGPWLTSLHGADRVGIVVSSRMFRIDHYGQNGGLYFERLYDAYGACMAAHRPATYVFSDDIGPDTLKAFKAILVVDQRVEIEPKLAQALAAAKAAGVPVFYDGASRPEVVRGFTPLGASFDAIDEGPIWQSDAEYARLPADFAANAAAMERTLGARVAPVAGVDDPAILLTERTSGSGRFVWALNEVEADADPGLAWRTGLMMTSRMPLVVPVRLDAAGAIYDVFAQRRVQPAGGTVDADLRDLPVRLFALLPRPVEAVALTLPRAAQPGGELAWSAAVLDDAGKAVETTVPLRVELVAGDGAVLERRAFSTDVHGHASGSWVVPLALPAGGVTVRVTEKFGGKEATGTVRVDASDRTPDLLAPPASSAAASGTATDGCRATTVGRDASASPPDDRAFGRHVKDFALLPGANLAVLGVMDRDENVYALDLSTGQRRWQRRVGNHFAYAPQAAGDGVAIEAFDRFAPEGYHVYWLGSDGQPQRRFALYGVPNRVTWWHTGALFTDRPDNFAVSPDGAWIASSGNLGLVVWSREGRRLWGTDWWAAARRTVRLLALDRRTLVTFEGPVATAHDAYDGHTLWTVRLGANGGVDGSVAATDGTLVVRTDVDGGRVFVLRGGRVVWSIARRADDASIAPDGRWFVLTAGHELEAYSVGGGLLWTFTGDDMLRSPRVAPDGDRVAVSSEIGTLDVLDGAGRRRWQRDYGALPVARWLGSDLVVATWMGNVERRDQQYGLAWAARLAPGERDARAALQRPDETPTTRVTGWGNAASKPAPLTPNLLSDAHARITVNFVDAKPYGWPFSGPLTDGKADAPDKPWIPWFIASHIESGWFGTMTLNVDATPSVMKVTGVTFVEDPAHPESWLRDVRVQYRAPGSETWVDGPLLLSDAATHTHWFDKPIEASRFRFAKTGGGTWPPANLRLGELVFHGTLESAPKPAAPQSL